MRNGLVDGCVCGGPDANVDASRKPITPWSGGRPGVPAGEGAKRSANKRCSCRSLSRVGGGEGVCIVNGESLVFRVWMGVEWSAGEWVPTTDVRPEVSLYLAKRAYPSPFPRRPRLGGGAKDGLLGAVARQVGCKSSQVELHLGTTFSQHDGPSRVRRISLWGVPARHNTASLMRAPRSKGVHSVGHMTKGARRKTA